MNPAGGFHYSIKDLEEMGNKFGRTLYDYFAPEILEAESAALAVAAEKSSGSVRVHTHPRARLRGKVADLFEQLKRDLDNGDPEVTQEQRWVVILLIRSVARVIRIRPRMKKSFGSKKSKSLKKKRKGQIQVDRVVLHPQKPHLRFRRRDL